MTRLFLGTASADITPALGLPLGGWPTHRPGALVHQPLEARSLRLACGDDVAIIVSLDLLGLSSALCRRIRTRIEHEFQIPASSVMLACTHTHSGPILPPWQPPEVAQPDDAYIESVCDQIVQVVADTGTSMVPVSAGYESAACDLGINRRLPFNDGLVGFPPRADPDGPVDSEVGILRFDADDGSVRAVLFSYGCHPTVAGMSEWIGPDFPGTARRLIESRFPDAMAVFLLGNCGDVRPNYTNPDGTFRWKTSTDLVERAGRKVGSAALRAAHRAQPDPAAALKVGQSFRSVYTSDNELLEQSEFLAFRIGEVTLASSPAECFCEIGLEVRETSPRPILFSSITNGFFGYVPTKQAYPYDGYEVSMSWKAFGLSGPVRDDAHQAFKDAMLTAINTD